MAITCADENDMAKARTKQRIISIIWILLTYYCRHIIYFRNIKKYIQSSCYTNSPHFISKATTHPKAYTAM